MGGVEEVGENMTVLEYGDDLIIIDTDKQKSLSAISKIRDFLSNKLHLTLHPRKIYFQYYTK